MVETEEQRRLLLTERVEQRQAYRSVPYGVCVSSGLVPPPAGKLSVRSLLAWHSDLLSPPHKDALAALGRYATNPAHAGRYAQLASHEGKQVRITTQVASQC